MERACVGNVYFMPRTGIVRITGYKTEKVAGTDCSLCQFETLYPEQIAGSQLVNTVTLRVPVTKEKISAVIRTLSQKPLKGGFGNWGKQKRRFDEKLQHGTPEAHAAVLRTLFDIDGKRAFGATEFYTRAQQYLAGEYAVVCNIPYSDAVIDIRQHLVEAHMTFAPRIPVKLKREHQQKIAAP